MTLRSLSIVALVLALAIAGWLATTHLGATGPTSKPGRRAQDKASARTADANFQAAFPALQAHFAENGTYAGANLPPAYGVIVARADATSYCLQAGTGEAMQHVVGPGGTPAPGPC